MATAITRYVNTLSSGGDGTTNNTSGGTAAYASLSAADAAELAARPGLVANDETLTFECNGTTADSTVVNIAGYTTDATRFITIRGLAADADGKFNGDTFFSTSHYRLDGSAVGNHTLQLNQGFTVVDGIQVSGPADSFFVGIYPSTTAGTTVRNCRIKGNGTGTTGFGHDGATFEGGSSTYTIENLIVAGTFKNGVCITADNFFTPTLNMTNCHVFGPGTTGVLAATNGGSAIITINAKNCVVFSTANDFNGTGTGTETLNITFCCTDDFDGTNAQDMNDILGSQGTDGDWADEMTDPGASINSANFTPRSIAASKLYNTGTSTGMPALDINGNTRVTPDIGAFFVAAAAGGAAEFLASRLALTGVGH